jgi:transcriptional regulator with XRE-family HTH domain
MSVMPVIESHPLRVARVRAGLSAEELGRRCGVSRGAINALEQGRIKSPRDELFVVLALANGVSVAKLRGVYGEWLSGFVSSSESAWREVEGELSSRARAVLSLSPDVVLRYGSFSAWRREVHPSVAGFASLLRVSATSLRRFEAGDVSMPKPLMRALFRVFRLGEDYVEALCSLDAVDVGDVARKYWRDRKRIEVFKRRAGGGV